MSSPSDKAKVTGHAIRAPYQFSLSSILLSMACIGASLAVLRWDIYIGGWAQLILIPAFIRTVIVGIRAARQGRPLSQSGKIVEWIFSVLIMVPVLCITAIIGALLLALAIPFLIISGGDGLGTLPMILAVLLAFAAGVFVFWRTCFVEALDVPWRAGDSPRLR